MAATAEPEEWVRGETKDGDDGGVQQVPLESEPHVTNDAKTIQVFKGIMDDREFSDLVLIVGPTKKRMAAHKFVVMTRSTVLRSMLSGEWHESKAGEISLPEDSPEVWKELLAHSYTGKWSNSPELLLELKDYADRYGFSCLAEECSERITALLSGEPENVMTMAAKAVAMANPVIRDLAFSSAFLTTAKALRSEGILRLDRDALLSFVSDPRCATDEVDVFRAVVRWGLNQMAVAHEEGTGPSPTARPKEDLEAAYAFLAHDIPGRAEAQEKCAGGGRLELEPAAKGSNLAREARRRGKAFIPPHEVHSAAASDEATFLSLTDAQLAGLPPKLRAMRLRAKDTMQHSVVQTADPAALREVLGEVLDAVRFPLIDAAGLAADVGPSGLISTERLVELYLHQMLPLGQASAFKTVAGFSNEPRAPVAKLITISLWGAGGASGKHASGAAGGAGGYIRVRYSLLPAEQLSVSVGEGGLADNSDSVMTSAAWPNGGKGGYNYKSGSGGGSSLVTSELHDGKVLVGAGGGGGGTAAHSWSSGGGGGGGCRGGKMGQGGHGQMRSAEALRIGSDGGGNGGKDDSSGSGVAGAPSHGAGGLSGSSTNANGGDGGEAFVLESAGVVLESKIDATSTAAVACDKTGRKAGAGGEPGDCKRGSHGLVIIENHATGTCVEFEFSEKEPVVVGFLDFARVSKDVLELLNQHGAGIRVNDFGFLLSKLMQLEASPAGGRGGAPGELSTDARRVMQVAAQQLPALLRDAIAAPSKGGSARQHSKARFSALSNVIEAFHTAADGDEVVLELAAAAAAESLAAGHPASVSRSASGLAAHGHLRGPFLAALAARIEAEAAAQLLARRASPRPAPTEEDDEEDTDMPAAATAAATSTTAPASIGEDAVAAAAKAALAALPAEPMDGFALLVTCTAAVGVLQCSPPSLPVDLAAAWRLVTAADEALPLLLPATQPRRRAANCVSAVDVVGRAILGAPSPAEARALLAGSAVLSSDWVIRTVGGADGQAAAAHLSRARQILARAASARSGDDGHAEAAAATVADALDAAISDDEGRPHPHHGQAQQKHLDLQEQQQQQQRGAPGMAVQSNAEAAASSNGHEASDPSASPPRALPSPDTMREQRAVAAALRSSTSADEALAVWEAHAAAFDPHLFANASGRIAAHIQRGADSSPTLALLETGPPSSAPALPARSAVASSSPASAADVAVSPLWPRARSFLRSARAAARAAISRGVVLHPGVTANLVWGMCRLEQAFPPVDKDDSATDGPARARHSTDPDEAGDFSRCLAELAAQAAPMVSNGTMAPLNVARLLAGLDAAKLGVVARAAGVVSAAEQRLEDDVDAFDDWQCVTTCFSGTRLGCRLGPNATEDLAKRARALLDDCAPAALAQAPRPGAPQAAPVAETAHRLCVFSLWALLHTPQRRQWQADARARAYLQAPAVAALLAQGFAASLAELMEPDESAADEGEDRRLMRRLRRAETVAQVAAALESAPGLLDLRHCVEASERLLRVERAVPEDSSDVDALLSRRARRARAQEAFNAAAAELGGRIAEASRHAAASGAMTMDFASHIVFCAGRLPLPASQRRDLVATLKPVIMKALQGAATGQTIDQRDVPRALAGLAQARADDSELTTALLRHFVDHSEDCTAVNALMVLQAVNTLVSPPAVLLERAMHRADDVICLAARKDDSGLTPGFAASALVLLVSELGMVSSQAALSLVPVLRRTASSLTPELARDAQAAVLEVIRHRTKGAGGTGERA